VQLAALRVATYRFRATFGRRWGGYLALVLLIGGTGGLAMGAVAGAVAALPARLAAKTPTPLLLRAE
jgi:hypothetical protein